MQSTFEPARRTHLQKVSWMVAVALIASCVVVSASARPVLSAAPVRDARCGRGSLPETTQGRTPAADYASGRVAKGYSCNTALIGHFGSTGGYKVLRYIDKAHHVCGYYDTTLLFPKDLVTNGSEGLGEYVLDMRNPAHPVHTATLSTPAMLSPHESVLLNAKRGLLVADMGYPTYNPGFVDVYDTAQDCLHPALLSSTPLGILGHESAFAADGRTFYVSSAGGHSLVALDLTNPKVPAILWASFAYSPHGMRLSDNGKYLYIADLGLPGLTILDVSQVQNRVLNPKVTEVARMTWPNVSIPQVPIPVTIHGHHYLLEIDEFSKSYTAYHATDSVGAARIINIDNVAHPYVVSNIRLAVNEEAARAGAQQHDPNATFGLQGYAGHYCSVPREVDPKIVACSFILSGERVFNIEDPVHPREVAYFNRPAMANEQPFSGGAFAMSQAAWDLARHEIWYSDGNSGFWVFKVTNGAWPNGL